MMKERAIACVIIIVLVIIHAAVCQTEPTITVHPQPWIANLGSKAEFSCTVMTVLESDEVNWRINGLSSARMEVLEPLVNIQQNSTTLTSTLTVTAKVVSTSTIQCRAISDISLPVLSQEVNLTVQGKLDTPTEPEAEADDFHVTISWTAPDTLDITNLDPDITYHLCNSRNTPCMTTTDTSYIFEVECSPVLYHVRACYSNSNETGCSDNATVMYPLVTIGFTLIKIEVMYDSDGDLLIHIHIRNEAFCSRGYSGLLDYRFGDGLDDSMEIESPIMPDINRTVHRLTLNQSHILENARYNGSIGSDGMMIEVNFLTFDVQDVTTTYMYTSEQDRFGDILVTCLFARGTRARGCIVVFKKGPTTRNITIMRSDENNPTEASDVMNRLPDGEYEVIAYDLEFDGTSDTDCEPVKKIFTFPPTTIPPSSSSTLSLLPSNSPPIVVTPGGSSSEDNVPVIISAVVAVVVVIVLVAVAVLVVLLKRNVQRKSTIKVHFATVQLATVEVQDSSNGDSPDDLSKREAAPPSRRLMMEFTAGGYAVAQDTSDTSSAPHPPSQPRVEYAEIQKPSLQANPNAMYAELGPGSSSTFDGVRDSVGRSKYTEIKPHHRQPDSACATEPGTEVPPPAPLPVPKVTVEALMDMLRELEPKWLVLGEAFGVPEHILDTIYTNDECRSTCMREMLKEYLQRGDATPTWRNVANTLRWMGEASLAEKIEKKYGIEIDEPGSVGFTTPVPAMPEDKPPPPPPPRISPDEDAPPIPPWLQGASDV